MGNIEFLVGINGPIASDLPTSIANLEDKSILFVSRWKKHDYVRAGSASQEAMVLLDFIANELLREKVERKGTATYGGSKYETKMNANCGDGVTGVSASDQAAMVALGPGAGCIMPQLGTRGSLTLDRLLNKIKHRNRHLANFRMEQDRHIFVICPEHTAGGAEGIYEFDVMEFCERCSEAAKAL